MNKVRKKALTNKWTVCLAILLLVVLALSLYYSEIIPLTFDSFVITIPGDAAAEVAEVVLAPFILLCVAVFLVLLFSGVGVVIMGSLALVGIVLVLVALPFLLPLLVPVFIIWISIVIVRRRKAALDTV